RAQQIQRQIRMTVGKTGVPLLRQLPVFARASPPFDAVFAFDQACRFEPDEVLARAGHSHGEARSDLRGGLRAAGLQSEQDAILAAVVLTHGLILETRYYLK